MRRTIAVMVLVFALMLVPTVAIAAPGGGKGGGKAGGNDPSSSLSLVLVESSDEVVSWGDKVTFDISTTATQEPHVDLRCSQGGSLVYSATAGYFDGYRWPWTQVMTLSSQAWTGGAADCVATLYYFGARKTVILASLSFQAQG